MPNRDFFFVNPIFLTTFALEIKIVIQIITVA